MTALERALQDIAAELIDSGIPFALVGGLAVSVRTEPRFTRDADLAVEVRSDADAEALIQRLAASGFSIVALVEQDAARRLATVRLTRDSTAGTADIDLLFASSGIEREVVDASERVEMLPGFHVAVATTGHLIALKVLSRDDINRPQDTVDLHALIRHASTNELTRARTALSTITARGFHRGRNLTHDFEQLLALLRAGE